MLYLVYQTPKRSFDYNCVVIKIIEAKSARAAIAAYKKITKSDAQYKAPYAIECVASEKEYHF